ncbi:glycoside hydrolase family 127 protein [Undibacterium sp. FT137W]|uniref:Glycoside hydrolase family 127 protein n=1 Tax=Undibacterium fentianense TaxID=2828728 RepID=A0A941E4V5_9BURK|nr:glycoside hydrolase family 127 protein [Undibacterium fentianense]
MSALSLSSFTHAVGTKKIRVLPSRAQAIPLKQVRLLASPYLQALKANRAYLLRLDANRFLHNYHRFAGLPTKGKIYGGWESDTIAGEGLGHYLSALALMFAQTGEPEFRDRIDYIVTELAQVQSAHGDGYIGGFMRKRHDGSIVDGKEIFAEMLQGEIRSAGFDLNGCWVPFYNWHKVMAGLLDAHALAENEQALQVLIGLATYIDRFFSAVNDQQLQQILHCEHGGINESFAELYTRHKDARWLALAVRLYHRQVLDPLQAQRDELANTHANTQIPKLIGLARLFEVNGDSRHAETARFFWNRVTRHHSYVIGGQGDREYFFEPDTIAKHLTEQTCEACCSYNMLKLTRHLYSWSPEAHYFDYYERTHLNHILAHQNPATGMFTYMTPLMAGVPREFSSEENDFWCCVLSGMESHAKHGDSIYWHADDCLFINLYIPSKIDWQQQSMQCELETAYPYHGDIRFRIAQSNTKKKLRMAFRIPAWASHFELKLNGEKLPFTIEKSYAIIDRQWHSGDLVQLSLPLHLRMEASPGNPRIASFLRGPLVLSADLGASQDPFDGVAPAIVGNQLLRAFTPIQQNAAHYQTKGIGRPRDFQFKPFYAQYLRRSAAYFAIFSDDEWAIAETQFKEEQARQQELNARAVDVMHLGEMQAERDHQLEADISYPVVYRGRNGRDARTGGFFSFKMRVKRGSLVLHATYSGEEKNRDFSISVDGTEIAHVVLNGNRAGEFIEQEYPIPEVLTQDKNQILIRFTPLNGRTAGPVFGCRLYTVK